MLAWLRDRLLRLILGRDLWYTTLLTMDVRDVEGQVNAVEPKDITPEPHRKGPRPKRWRWAG